MAYMTYGEYQWEILRHFELYEAWKRDDFHLLAERESKACRYVLYIIWDLLNIADRIEDEDTKKELIELALKYFTFIVPEIKSKAVVELLIERFRENGKEVDER